MEQVCQANCSQTAKLKTRGQNLDTSKRAGSGKTTPSIHAMADKSPTPWRRHFLRSGYLKKTKIPAIVAGMNSAYPRTNNVRMESKMWRVFANTNEETEA
jgi:hypothetical protein